MTSNGWSPLGYTIGPVTQEPRVLIALPVYSGMAVEFVGTLLNALSLLNTRGIPVRIEFLQGDSLVPRARNNLAHQWYHQTRIPFFAQFDTDLILDSEGIVRLLSHPPEFAVIGGCYPKKKTGPAEWVCNPIPNVGPREDGLQEVWEMGTGLLRIHRSVYAAVKASYPQLVYTCDGNNDERLDLFPVGTWPDALNKRNRYLSEDWYFCQLARALGFKIWADTKCAARHLGQVAYPWPPEQQLTAPPAGPGQNAAGPHTLSPAQSIIPPIAPPPCSNVAGSSTTMVAPPPPNSNASTLPPSSSGNLAGALPPTSGALSAALETKSSGRGRTRRKARGSPAS